MAFQDWPGFTQLDFQSSEAYSDKIVGILEERQQLTTDDHDSLVDSLYKKANPEAEALVIIAGERKGEYHMLSEDSKPTPSWFVSNTSLLNAINDNSQSVTWQPDAFLRFTATLSLSTDEDSSERAFQALLWGCAQAGLNLLSETTIQEVMGGMIDQAAMSISEQKQVYVDNLESKYSEPIEQVLTRIRPVNRPLAAIQLANEMLLKQELRMQQLEAAAEAARKRAISAEKQLAEVEKFQRQMEARKAKSSRNSRKQKSKKAKTNGKKKRR